MNLLRLYILILKQYDLFSDFVSLLDTDLTYMFELVGPYNRVVVPYAEPEIYFLGARNKFTGEEFNCASDVVPADIQRPKQWPLTSLEECIKITETFNWDQEGFVVSDANFNRVKIKSPAYVIAHYARNNNVITRKHLIKVILMNEVEEFLCYAAEYKEELLYVQKLMNAYHNIGDTLATVCRKASILSRPVYADIVKTLPKVFHDLLFKNYDKDCYAEEYTYGWSEDKWERYLDELERYLESLRA